MKLGARILKTGIAIVLAIYVARFFHMPGSFAAISAIFAIQPTIYRSYITILEQVQANIVGAIAAAAFVLLLGNDPFIIGLAAIIVITVNLKLNMKNSVSIALVTLIAIMESQGGNFAAFAATRFSTILIGILSAFVVNLVFLPPKYETRVFNKMSDLTEEIFQWIRINTRHASDHGQLKNELQRFREDLLKMEQLYALFKEERKYFKREKLAKSRKLVVYRQMITTTKKALDALKRLHRYENELQQMPEEFQQKIQDQMDMLIYNHEQVLLKYRGKITHSFTIEESANTKELVSLLMDRKEELEEDRGQCLLYHMVPLAASIIEYEEAILHLDMLITSFHSFHSETNEVALEQPEEI
ncbi:FUSC family protein [Peribacillus kribbensis]|uniref:FUSC family protein n=1 Tax=Peribacillus kribbensis TaxID=356658 RepID=UPI0004116DC4|nr:aromatic acid exporter family protein [Peribacillus kribbensis]